MSLSKPETSHIDTADDEAAKLDKIIDKLKRKRHSADSSSSGGEAPLPDDFTLRFCL